VSHPSFSSWIAPRDFARRGLALAALSVFSAAACLAATLNVRVEPPPGVQAEALSVRLLPGGISEVENDPPPPPWQAIPASGEFTLEATSPTASLLIEFTGPGARRACFAWPAELANDPQSRSVHRLETGAAMEIFVTADGTGRPVAGARLGPLSPTEDVSPEWLGKTYPFFAESDAQGRIWITGLIPGQAYEGVLSADSYQRRKIRLAPGGERRFALKQGGFLIAGEARGDRTGAPKPGILVRLNGGPENLQILRRADEKGRFAFAGLAEGNYLLTPVEAGVDLAPPLDFSLAGGPLEGVWLPVSEGIRITGSLSDAETGAAAPGATLRLGAKEARTNAAGEFAFEGVMGPWPASVRVECPGYVFREEDQRDPLYPFNGFAMNDLLGVSLVVSKKRVLEVLVDAPPEARGGAILNLFGPLGVAGRAPASETRRVNARRALFPLGAAGERIAWMVDFEGRASDVTRISTALEDTTTTLRLTLAPGAALEASLVWSDPEIWPPPSRLTLALEDGSSQGKPLEIFSANSEERGVYHLKGLPPGEFLATFWRPEGEPYAQERIALRRGETATLHKVIERGFEIAGHVKDEEGNLQKYLEISLYGKDPDGAPLHVKVQTDARGSFRSAGWGGPALERLQIQFHDFEPFLLENLALPAEPLEIVLKKRAGVVVEIAAPESSLQTARAWLLAGRQRSDEALARQWFYEAESVAPFGGEREVTLFPISGGRYRVAAQADGQWDVSEAFEWVPGGGEARRFLLTPGRGGSIEVALEGLNETDAADLDVTLLNTALPGAAASTEFRPSGGGGAERLEYTNLPAGEYALMAVSPAAGFASLANLDLPSGGRLAVALRFSGAAVAIEGRVVSGGAEERPIAGARVSVRFGDVAEASPLMEEAADAQGRFSFYDLPAGRPYLVEAAQGALQARARVEAAAGERRDAAEPVQVLLRLEPPVAVTLRLPEAAREQLARAPGAPLVFTSLDGERSRIHPLSQGLEGIALEPGEYRVAHGETPLGRIRVPSGADEAEVDLEPAQ